jgi:chromosome partitioning protein
MRTIAITNQKGGSGKTTTAVNVAAALGEGGQRVLVVDLDPQGSATAWLGVQAPARTVYDVFAEDAALLDVVVAETSAPGVALAPSGPLLTRAERNLGGDMEALAALRRALEQTPADAFDLVLVDCPPAVAFLTPAALVGCRELVVPVEARVMALQGLASMVQTVDRLRSAFNAGLTLSGILPCRVDARTNLSREVVDALRTRFGPTVFTTAVRENVRLAEAPSHAQPITRYAPTSPGAEDYRAVAAELLARAPGAALPVAAHA